MKTQRFPAIAILLMVLMMVASVGCPSGGNAPSADKMEQKGDPNCPKCHGTGTIVVNVQETCSTCEGTGKVLDRQCQTCKGKGTMTVAQEQDCPACSKKEK
jgi:DnaJ-class molecular chaperone